MKQLNLHFKKIGIGTFKELGLVLPIFLLAVFVGVLMDKYISDQIIQSFADKYWLWAIPLATVIGIIAPIPRYATYPIAFALLIKGAGFGIVFGLIGGEVICESLARDFLEIKYLGWKFFSARLVFSIIFISLGGYIMEILL